MSTKLASQIPFAEGLFTWPSDNPQLIGGQCGDCGQASFPRNEACGRCASSNINEILLGRRGTLWTFTRHGYSRMPLTTAPGHGSEAHEPMKSFVMGYVELPRNIRIETRIVDVTFEDLQIGMDMEFTLVPLKTTTEGREVVVHAFRPLKAALPGNP